eukprot:2609229-Pyramimonas_sp.AAC.1
MSYMIHHMHRLLEKQASPPGPLRLVLHIPTPIQSTTAHRRGANLRLAVTSWSCHLPAAPGTGPHSGCLRAPLYRLTRR